MLLRRKSIEVSKYFCLSAAVSVTSSGAARNCADFSPAWLGVIITSGNNSHGLLQMAPDDQCGRDCGGADSASTERSKDAILATERPGPERAGFFADPKREPPEPEAQHDRATTSVVHQQQSLGRSRLTRGAYLGAGLKGLGLFA